MSDGAGPLANEKYLRLVTYKRDGTGVGTPLWFAELGGRYVASTGDDTGKVKRIRNNPSVTVTACNVRGQPRGPERHGTVRLLEPTTDADRIERALNAKYAVRRPFMTALAGFEALKRVAGRPGHDDAYLEITLD